MNEPKINKEMAEQEFDRFLEAMDIEADPVDMDEEDKKGFEQQKGRIVSAIMSGSVVIDDDGQPIFIPKRSGEGEAITFYEPTGASLMAMDRKKKAEDVGKLFTTMADMTKQPAKRFASMKYADLKVCIAITTLFLG